MDYRQILPHCQSWGNVPGLWYVYDMQLVGGLICSWICFPYFLSFLWYSIWPENVSVFSMHSWFCFQKSAGEKSGEECSQNSVSYAAHNWLQTKGSSTVRSHPSPHPLGHFLSSACRKLEHVAWDHVLIPRSASPSRLSLAFPTTPIVAAFPGMGYNPRTDW